MMYRRALATLGVAGLMCAGYAGVASTSQADSNNKVSICHRTGSAVNPYVQITVSKVGADAHLKHHDGTLNWPAAPYSPALWRSEATSSPTRSRDVRSRLSRHIRAPSSPASSALE